MFCWLDEFSRQNGLSSAWARVFFLYGPHEPPQRLVPAVVSALLRDEPARCTAGAQIRDYLYVEDVAGALACLLAGRVTGAVNVASGKPTHIRDLVVTIADKLNRRDLLQLGAIPEKADDPPVLIADVRRLSHECGWSPRFDLDAALEKTIDWWKLQGRTAHL
jgi:nucleoside-diphosphate-sugar epimerase